MGTSLDIVVIPAADAGVQGGARERPRTCRTGTESATAVLPGRGEDRGVPRRGPAGGAEPGGQPSAPVRSLDPPGPGQDGDHQPEDWVGSTTTVSGSQTDGLTRLPDGPLLRDAINADPESYLGPEHVQRPAAALAWSLAPVGHAPRSPAARISRQDAHRKGPAGWDRIGAAPGSCRCYYHLRAGLCTGLASSLPGSYTVRGSADGCHAADGLTSARQMPCSDAQWSGFGLMMAGVSSPSVPQRRTSCTNARSQ